MTLTLIKQIVVIWFLIIIVLTIRGITPRYKTDVLITIIWKILLPIVLLDLLFIIIDII